MAGLVTSPASGGIDQSAAISYNRIIWKCKAGIFARNQSIMGNVYSPSSGISPVTIDTVAVCFKVRGVAFNTTVMAFIKIRTC
jgi:hypothetical protein